MGSNLPKKSIYDQKPKNWISPLNLGYSNQSRYHILAETNNFYFSGPNLTKKKVVFFLKQKKETLLNSAIHISLGTKFHFK